MKPDSTTSVGKFRRIVYRALTATCAIALTAGLAGCGNSTAGTVTLDFRHTNAVLQWECNSPIFRL